MKNLAIVIRTLKEGKNFEDYRKAWFHTKGYGVETQMYTALDIYNPKKIISVGIVDFPLKDAEELLNAEVEERLKNPLDDIIEETIIRYFGTIEAEDDFSENNELTYCSPRVNNIEVDFESLLPDIKELANYFTKASQKRDKIKSEKYKGEYDKTNE